MAGFVAFCFDGCFVKCFRHGPSVIFQFQTPISHLREAYCTRKHNYKNEMWCRYKAIVTFVGVAFSLDTSINLGLVLK